MVAVTLDIHDELATDRPQSLLSAAGAGPLYFTSGYDFEVPLDDTHSVTVHGSGYTPPVFFNNTYNTVACQRGDIPTTVSTTTATITTSVTPPTATTTTQATTSQATTAPTTTATSTPDSTAPGHESVFLVSSLLLTGVSSVDRQDFREAVALQLGIVPVQVRHGN